MNIIDLSIKPKCPLRNELLNDTEDWDRVRDHAKGITTWDKAWNKEPSLLEKIF